MMNDGLKVQSDYVNADFNTVGQNASGLISFGIGAGNNVRHSTLNVSDHHSDQQTIDMTSSVAAKDTYLKMLKNKEKFTKKVVVGSGFGLQKKSNIPSLHSGNR